MTKERFLTVRWNNLLTFGLGIPALLYVIVVLSTSILSDNASFVVFAIIGVVY